MTIRAFATIVLLLTSNARAQEIPKEAPKPTFTFVAAQDGGVGSTMTLQDLQQTKRKKRAEIISQPVSVQPAAEPVPALRYQFQLPKWNRKAGSALMHYNRAQILFLQIPKEKQHLWQTWSGDDITPTDQELADAVTALKSVYDELHSLAVSEDMTWDHRLRDLRGPAVYAYTLPDVQEIRSMARLLRIRIRHQVKQGDFDGAVSSVGDGLRLAEFVGQGETLIQKLVGIACASIMRDGIREIITTPGSPNLYWALAGIPRPPIDVSESVLWELNNIHKVLPVLNDAESGNWSEADASTKWSAAVADLNALSSGILDGPEANVALAIASVTFADQARQRLLQNGFDRKRLERLPALQIVLIDASQELRRIADEMGKGHLLPANIARPVLQREEDEFRLWQKDNRMRSVGSIIASLLFPAVRQAKEAETRTLMTFNRLMTLEALRMYAAEHDGKLPESLEELSTVPALPDPYTGQPFKYEVKTEDGVSTITLTAAGPVSYRPMQTLRAVFRD